MNSMNFSTMNPNWVWGSLVAHGLRESDYVGSNPATQTHLTRKEETWEILTLKTTHLKN